MKTLAKLIHKTHASYLPTAFPAHYYGMPNGKIYLVFSQFYEAALGNTGLEFVFAEHKDYLFDYEKGLIVPCSEKGDSPVFAENVDRPRAKINVINTSRELNSYGEAQGFLNREAQKMAQTA